MIAAAGGFKLWEGGMDLADFLAEDTSLSGPGALAGRRALELGCGHGLPGVVALLAGASVHFQDYNGEVLQALTIPCVAANWGVRGRRAVAAAPAAVPDARYFSGDWRSLPALLASLELEGTYDLVLSAETIYSLAGISSLHECIKQVRLRAACAVAQRPKELLVTRQLPLGALLQCLKRPSGVAYIAAKSFYFGVGGGVAAFLELVQRDGGLSGAVVKVINNGQSNRREIIKLCWK